jgi:hypothetical protein
VSKKKHDLTRKQARQTSKCYCVNSTFGIEEIQWDDAEQLCKTGHARWKRVNLIEIIRNIHGPALSLRVGAELAFYAGTKKGKDWAGTAISDIVGRH